LSLTFLIGCTAQSFQVVPVSGQVTLDGKPAAGIHVTFTPVAERPGQEVGVGSTGVTDAQGRFTLRTIAKNRRSGAVVGKHSVVFSVPAEQAPDQDVSLPPKIVLPERFTNGSIIFEVPPGGTNKADFALTTK